jgi:starch synthase (maltosyl-transferring)
VKIGDEMQTVVAVENLLTGERHAVEWGGLRLRIDPSHDPALLFRCMA